MTTSDHPPVAGVPTIEADARADEIPLAPRPGELGAHEYGRRIALWLARLFDAPIQSVTYRENPWDRRACPRAQTYEIRIKGHLVLVTSYDAPTRDGHGTTTAHAVHVDGQRVPFTPRPGAANVPWQLASAAWHGAVRPGQG